MYNRHERRKIAKNLGMTKEKMAKENGETVEEITRRMIAAGKQIHQNNKEEVLNAQIKAEAEKEAKILQSLMEPTKDRRGKVLKEGLSYEEAMKMIKHNRQLDMKKQGF